jgi:HSP20 family molecular chaperone IbpA
MARWRPTVFAPFDFSGLFPFLNPEIRVEQLIEDGHYVVRAEIPGVDPDKELEVTVADGLLKIHAERTEEKRERAHSEFHYGRFDRTVTLPLGAMEDTAVAKYASGILEVSVKLGEPKEFGRRLPIEVTREKSGKITK